MFGKQQESLLISAIKKRDLELVKQIVDSNPEILKQQFINEERPLLTAINSDNLEVVKQLLKAGVDPNLGDWTSPLNLAIEKGNTNFVRLLLKAGANPNLNYCRFPLNTAVTSGYLDIVKILISAGADVDLFDNNDGTNIYIAACLLSKKIYNYLALFTSSEQKKWSDIQALLYSSRNGNTAIIIFLVESGVDVNIIFDDLTFLMEATRNHQLSSVQTLLELGANVNIKNRFGITALILSVRFRNSIEAKRKMKGENNEEQLKVVNIILNANANINDRDNDGKTALIHAAEFSSPQILKLLIDFGANINEKDNKDMSALDYANQLNNLLPFEKVHRSQIINLLKEAGAKET
jgi:ankyrin repeat protein